MIGHPRLTGIYSLSPPQSTNKRSNDSRDDIDELLVLVIRSCMGSPAARGGALIVVRTTTSTSPLSHLDSLFPPSARRRHKVVAITATLTATHMHRPRPTLPLSLSPFQTRTRTLHTPPSAFPGSVYRKPSASHIKERYKKKRAIRQLKPNRERDAPAT